MSPWSSRHARLLGNGVVVLALALQGWVLPDAGLSPTFDAAAQGRSFWPGAGLALGMLYLWRTPMLPAVLLGWLCCLLLAGLPLPSALALALGRTLGPWLAINWLRRQGFNPRLLRTRDLLLLVVAALGSAALVASGGSVWLLAQGLLPVLDLPVSALRWWVLDTLGVLVFAVPLLTRQPMQLATGQSAPPNPAIRLLVGTCLACALTALALPALAALAMLWLLPPALLCGLCFRFGLATASATLATLVLLLLLGTAAGFGPYAPGSLGMALPGSSPAQAGLWIYAGLLVTLMLLAHAQGSALLRHSRRSRRALSSAGLGLADWQPADGLVSLSPRWRELNDDPSGHDSLSWEGWLVQIDADDRAALVAAMGHGARQPLPWRHRAEIRLHTEGGWRWRELQLEVTDFDAQGQPLAVLATLADSTARHEALGRHRLVAQVLAHLHEGLLITDADLRVVELNQAYSRITGFDRHALLGQVPGLLQPEADDVTGRSRQASLWAELHSQGHWAGDLPCRHRHGQQLQLSVSVSRAETSDVGLRHYIVLVNDITEQQRQHEQLLRQAHFDELTRLPNRARLGELMAQAMVATDRDGYLLVVCVLDLDHFKAVNARHGHVAGDELLAELANRMRSALRSRDSGWSDSAARLGGDEFVLLLRAGTLDEARAAVERVLRVLSQPLQLAPGLPAERVTASVGATVYPLDASDADTLLRHADQAMYSVKQSGRNGYLFFDPEYSRRTEQRVLAIGRVQNALDQGELQLYYQPKVDLKHDVVLGVEALLRWIHPDHGVLPPAQFLPLIERTGLSARVGDHVLAQALNQLEVWQAQGLDLSVSVNISGRHLQEPDFALRLSELLARHDPSLGQRLELEVLETVALTDIAYTSALMARCGQSGVRWALDDFGTGYSTLTYLKRLPVQVLKIDRSFVQNMLSDSQDRAIVEGVIGLASTFGCVAVAEGVESAAQARMLLSMGCHIGQGMAIAAPMPAAEVGPWVREWRGLLASSDVSSSVMDGASVNAAPLDPIDPVPV